MTYQELLDEFNARRAKNTLAREDVDLLLWAMQQLIEKLRDEETFKRAQAVLEKAKGNFTPTGLPYWKDR